MKKKQFQPHSTNPGYTPAGLQSLNRTFKNSKIAETSEI